MRFNAETRVRSLAAKNPGTYNIALFACNRDDDHRYQSKFISAADKLDNYWDRKGREAEQKLPQLERAMKKYHQTRERRSTLSCVNARTLSVNILFGV